MALESYIRAGLKKKDILLMTHTVIGYPSLKVCFKLIDEMVRAGVDLIELQIPFSEPIADGPVILRANHKALKNGVTVRDCLDFARSAAHAFDIPFLIMTYYNIPFTHKVSGFVSDMAKIGLKGAIVPDLPPEEGRDYLKAMKEEGLDPILILSPTTPLKRMKFLGQTGSGFIYCVARKGVTGIDTRFSQDLEDYLSQCRNATSLPLAVGFGVRAKADIDFLKGKADVAVIGTEIIRIMEQEGIPAVGDFIRGLGQGPGKTSSSQARLMAQTI